MNCVPTSISGAMHLVPAVWPDERGAFFESYARSRYYAAGITEEFVQDNTSYSVRGVLRGLHGDPRMSKLVQAVRGEIFDVVVDARAASPTFGRWESFVLSEENHAQIYIPAGCLHGFLALTDAIVCYKQSAEYAPQKEIGVRWDDPDLAISWPDLGSPPIVSAKDRSNKLFGEVFR